MTTLRWIDLRCPVCESVFESMAALSTDDKGPYYIHPSARGTSVAVLPFLIHVCRRCGYAGGVGDFDDDVEVTDELRRRVWSELAPELGTSVRIPWLALTVAGSDKYDGAARIAEWRGDDARYVAELWIRAAWCCTDEEDVEAERYYARRAARWFERAGRAS
jgi:hypothetical protein